MNTKYEKVKLDLIFEHYTQQELAHELVYSQWELLTRMKDHLWTKGDVRRINKIYNKLKEEAKQ